MSTKVNRAKGARGFSEVAFLASQPPRAVVEGLRGQEWARLASIMVGAEDLRNVTLSLGPLLTRIPEDVRIPLYFLIQQMILGHARRATSRNQLIKSLNRIHPVRDRHSALVCAAERLSQVVKTVSYGYDALADEKVQALLRGWFVSLPSTSTSELVRFCEAYGGSRRELNVPKSWALKTRGRF